MRRSVPAPRSRSVADRRITDRRAPARSDQAARAAEPKHELHPRNRHRGRYDFPRLIAACPALARFVARNRHGDESVDFADPEAVKTLNRALLAEAYGISAWQLPDGCLCPPIPGRADYLHHLADLLAADHGGTIPRGPAVRVLDVGVGASCIYPLIGHAEYGWSFVGTDIDAAALASAQRIVRANRLATVIALRRQPAPARVFAGVLQADEDFDLAMCNPPFHASAAEARAGSLRKWRNLGKPAQLAGREPALNFGGAGAELWCPGGEGGFVRRMIAESARIPERCRWFTSLVSKESSLPGLLAALRAAGAADARTIAMAQGQKRSRVLAWTFLDGRRRSRPGRR
jgi:23S rRNA (adenine1618-N6)-methyltransferase